jgi:secreted trypsin-like serine protease
LDHNRRTLGLPYVLPVIVGVVSWSTGASNTAGCGGLTGVTPLTLYRDWILQTAKSCGR